MAGAIFPDPPLKILFLVHSLGLAGAERQITVLAKALAGREHRVSVISFYGGPLQRDLRENGVPVYLLKSGRGVRGLTTFLFRLVRLIRRERPDILHSYLESPNVLAVLLKPFVPGVRIVWGVRSTELGGGDFSRLELLFQFLCRQLARFADFIIVNSRRGYSVCRSAGYPQNRTTIVFNGIDLDRFKPDPDARRRFRTELGFTDTDLVLGRVGRLHGMKDYDTFLKVGALLVDRWPTLKLVCIGSGPVDQWQRLADLAHLLHLGNRITFLKERLDIATVYNGLDVLVSSSRYGEGFPNVIAEAMSCGVRSVATDVGDAAFIIGDQSLTAPVGDAAALAKAVTHALANPTPADAERLRSRIREHFSIDRLVTTTENILLRLRRQTISPPDFSYLPSNRQESP